MSVDLLPFVVLLGDTRWAACVDELRGLLVKPKAIGLDTEFYEDPMQREQAEASGRDLKGDNFDPWSTRLRLLQIGLPSGLSLILDFGQHFDPAPFANVLPIIGAVLADPRISKFGWSLSTEALILRRHFGWIIRKPRDGMLASQVLWAGVAAKKVRWTRDGQVPQEALKHSFQAAAERVSVEIDKTEQMSDWGAEVLTTKQLNYAALDVHRDTLVEVWKRLYELARDEGVAESVIIECDSAPAFWECEWRGTPLDADVCRTLIGDYKRVGDDLYAHVCQTLGCAAEGEGSRNQLALRLSAHLGVALYYWKRGTEIRNGFELTPEEAKPPKLPKPRKPSKKSSAEYREAFQGLLTSWETAQAVPAWRLIPSMGEKVLAAYDTDPVVSNLLEARSCRSTQGALEKRLRNSWPSADGRLATRCRYWQIAGSFDGARDASDGAGGGMGRSSSSKPLNNQNMTTLPLGKRRHDELNLPNARVCVKPGTLRAMIVGDFSQAHMRFAAEASQDPALCDDFRAGRDAHIRLAREFALSLGSDDPKQAELCLLDFAQWCEAYQVGKKNAFYYLIKELRRPAKTGNYTELNLGSPDRLRQAAETDPEPLHLPRTITVNGEQVDPWVVIRDRWREVNAVLYQFQRETIRRADRSHCSFAFADGDYGEVWSVDKKRRLYLLKEWNIPAWAESDDDGRYSVKGTDCVSAVWMMSEANALKIALALVMAEFDAHPEWEAFVFNIVHDEINAECAKDYALPVAQCVKRCMDEGLRRAGLVSIPVCAPDDTAEKLIVSCWADK